MKSKMSQNAIILLIVTAIVVVVNYLVGGLSFLNFRLDFTEKRLFTLSEGTRNIVKGLNPDKPVTIRFYATRDSRLMPQWVQTYASTVQDLLLEIEKASDYKVTLERIDPRPNTEEEDKAIADDIQGLAVNEEGDKAYFGIAIHCLQQKEVIPVLNPNLESALEYQIARALAKVTTTKRNVIGVMSPMPIAGPAFNLPPMLQQGRQTPPWEVIKELRQNFDVREVATNAEAIDADISVLLVIHPSGLPVRAEFAIDQYLLKGGKVIAFVDPNCYVSQRYNNPGQMGVAPTVSISPTSNLTHLFKAWGITFDPTKVVADMQYRTEVNRRAIPTFLTIDQDGINNSEPITSALVALQMFTAGALGVDKVDGVTATTLVQSSENSELIDISDAEKAQKEALTTFQSGGRRHALAVRLTGKFKSAFPDGQPAAEAPGAGGPGGPGSPMLPGGFPGGTGGEDGKPAGAPAAATTAAAEKKDEKPASLKESQNNEGVVLLVSDVDMLDDMFSYESDQTGRSVGGYRNSNVPLVMNTVDMFGGGADLIAVRSRAATKRPFTQMQALKDEVERQYRPLIEQKNKELEAMIKEIADLGGVQQQQGLWLLNPNKEQKRLLEASLEAKQKEMRDLQKAQNRRKDQREFMITALNLLAVPLLIIAFGLALAIRRRALQVAH